MAVLLFLFALLVPSFALASVPQSAAQTPPTSFPVRSFVVNLDLPPQQRWAHVAPYYRDPIQGMFNFVTGFIPSFMRQEVMDAVATVGAALEFFLGDYGLEIEGIANVVGIPPGDIALVNLLYEMVSMCTSIVAETDDGRILHSRNLDFGLGTDFTTLLQNLTIQVEFQKGGKTIYYGTTYAAYVGLLTGMAPGRFGLSLNLRHSGDILGNLKELLNNPASNVVSFLLRSSLENDGNYQAALKRLVSEPLISESYIIVSGTRAGEGAVITRNRTVAADVWSLDESNERWYLLQTNHDHWRPSPPGDHRSEVGDGAMSRIGRSNISSQAIYEVLSTKPLLNAQTTYTTSMVPYNATYSTYKRICPPPCSLHAPVQRMSL
jgi:acid ceramidase